MASNLEEESDRGGGSEIKSRGLKTEAKGGWWHRGRRGSEKEKRGGGGRKDPSSRNRVGEERRDSGSEFFNDILISPSFRDKAKAVSLVKAWDRKCAGAVDESAIWRRELAERRRGEKC